MESKLAHVNIIMNLSVSIGAFKVVYSANGFLSCEFLLSVKLINCVDGANRELFTLSGIKIIQVSYIYRRKAPSSNCKYLTKRLFDDL